MKKKKNKKNLNFILYILVIISLSCVGCGSKIEITEITQKRTEECERSFEAWKVNGQYAEYVIEKSVEEDKENALELVKSLEEQEEKILDYTNTTLEKPISVWIVNTDIVGTGNITDTYVSNKSIITGKEQVENGEYLATYVKESTGIKSYWLAYGIIAEAINDEKSMDYRNKQLAEYYENAENMGILGLADTRFLSQLCTEEEIQIARDTAASFYDYWKGKQKTEDINELSESLNEKDLTEEKNDWLTSIGVTKEYDYPYEGLYDISVGISHQYEKGIAASGKYADHEIKLQEDDTYFMSNVENVERFFYNNQHGAQKLYDSLKKADNSDLLPLERRAKYRIEEQNNIYQVLGGETDVNKSEIIIDSSNVLYCHLHELTHLWTQPEQKEKTTEDIWFGEGIACYGALQVEEYCGVDIKSYKDVDYFFVLAKMLESADTEEAKKILELYKNAGGSMEENQFNHTLFNNIYVYENIEKYGLETAIQNYDYPYYESFMNYLVENYSLEDVIEVVTKHQTVEETFGKNFEDLQQEWMNRK